MRAFTLLFPIMAGLLIVGARAQTMPSPDYTSACKTSWNAMASADKAKTTYSDYLKTCSANGPTAAPPANTVAKPVTKMSNTQKQAACEKKWTAQQKIMATGTQTRQGFLQACMSSS
jgi:hypothetical protein